MNEWSTSNSPSNWFTLILSKVTETSWGEGEESGSHLQNGTDSGCRLSKHTSNSQNLDHMTESPKETELDDASGMAKNADGCWGNRQNVLNGAHCCWVKNSKQKGLNIRRVIQLLCFVLGREKQSFLVDYGEGPSKERELGRKSLNPKDARGWSGCKGTLVTEQILVASGMWKENLLT